ncbi:Na/Pi cotransporter family protein [Photobacterium sp. SDRW27]|uniref:Na/Pi cotransporter family protein n=1 Tax=Photobacterium obscurum TaxID=2829490 RepID=UPI002243BDE6|nr:Na/Pi cotransporter family protein [Photobacterium obscurum]MCW8329878.1 Na/Pi cotransporter family protein [Photobacterium obscurum]
MKLLGGPPLINRRFLTAINKLPLKRQLLFFSIVLIQFNGSAYGSETTAQTMNWSQMSMGLLGGLALFLFGMDQMSDALKSALGDKMKVLLANLTRNRFSGALTGAFVTAVVQSSSITTVLVVGFVSAGMMTMSQSIGMIMGANVGTTITAQIVAFQIEEAALGMVAIGFLMLFASSQERIKHYGGMLMGLGLIFYGMGLIGDAMYPLRSYEPFLNMMNRMDQPLLAILFGAIFTAIVQSSSATTAIVITMAGQGLISLEAGIVLAFGANIGTCITAQLAAIGKSRDALRAACIHLFFNLGGVLIWLPFTSILAYWVVNISPTHPELEGTARLAAEVPRQIANAHSLFNIINTLVFIGFTNYLAKLVEWLVPLKEVEEKLIIRPQYLDDTLIETPALALQRVRLENARMGEIVYQMLTEFRKGTLSQSRSKLESVREMDDQVDVLEGDILRYLGTLRQQSLTEQESANIELAMIIADEFESIGDVIETDLTNLAYRALDENIKPTDTVRHIHTKLGNQLLDALSATIRAVKEEDQSSANDVINMQVEVDHLIKQALDIQSQALAKVGSKQIEAIRMEMSILESFKRIYTFLKRIARKVVPPEVRE